MGLRHRPNVNVLGFTPPPLLLLLFLFCLLHVPLSSSSAVPPSSAPPYSPGGFCSSAVVSHGYKCQEFDVATPDGYILKLIRIPEGLALEGSASAGGPRQPVLIQHGVLVDGLSWLLNSPELNLPFILADNGFDIWISNTRGTRFSRRHTSLDPAYQEYWDWSWDELVSHDLPAMFDFVHAQTGSKVDYVGHSQGTLTALASLSEGRLGDKIRSAVLLSPIAYLSHMTTALGVVAARAFLGEITTLFGLAEFDPYGEPVGRFVGLLCAFPEVVCNDLLSDITGQNCCLNTSTTDSFIKKGPQSTSTKNLVHLSQTVRDGVLTMYDYGLPAANVKHYGDYNPPAYNLSNIPRELPMFLSYGAQDALSDVRDVNQLLSELRFHDPDRLVVQRVEDYGHADFIMAVNAKDVVYKSVVSFLNQW